MTLRIIKRYENRKLYDTEARTYVSLNDVAQLVRNGHTVQVLDNASGDDWTNATLTQIILEEGKKGNSLIPTDFLHDVVRKSAHVLEDGVTQFRQNVDEFVQASISRLGQWLPATRQEEELQALRTQLRSLETLLSKMLDTQNQTQINQQSSTNDEAECKTTG